VGAALKKGVKRLKDARGGLNWKKRRKEQRGHREYALAQTQVTYGGEIGGLCEWGAKRDANCSIAYSVRVLWFKKHILCQVPSSARGCFPRA